MLKIWIFSIDLLMVISFFKNVVEFLKNDTRIQMNTQIIYFSCVYAEYVLLCFIENITLPDIISQYM